MIMRSSADIKPTFLQASQGFWLTSTLRIGSTRHATSLPVRRSPAASEWVTRLKYACCLQSQCKILVCSISCSIVMGTDAVVSKLCPNI